MPGLYDARISRKRFLETCGATFGALTMGASRSRAAEETSASRDELHLALLSDTHIPADRANGYRGFTPEENLKQVLPQILSAQPSAAIICGDAARLDGQRKDYEKLKELLRPLAEKTPVHIALGNHDDRANFFRVFPAPSKESPLASQKHVSVLDAHPIRVIVLDSLLYVNRVAGLLGKSQRTWLSEFLLRTEPRPTVLFVHHTLGDGDGDLLDVDRLFRMLDGHSQVKAIFYGHSHRYAVETKGPLKLINLPAVGYNFKDSEPVGWVDAVFTTDGVDMRLHAVGGDQSANGDVTNVEWS